MKIAEARDGEVAGGLLNNLNKFLLGSNESKIREILKRFHKYAAYGKIIRNINLRLLKTFGGMYIDSFSKWRDLPERTDYTIGSKFEQALLHFSRRVTKRIAFNPLVDL